MVGRAKYSIRDVFIGWVAGDGLVGKVKYTVQNYAGRALVRPKNQPGGVVLAP